MEDPKAKNRPRNGSINKMKGKTNRPEAAEGAIPMSLQQPRLLNEGEGDQEGCTPLRRPEKIFMPQRAAEEGRRSEDEKDRTGEARGHEGIVDPQSGALRTGQRDVVTDVTSF